MKILHVLDHSIPLHSGYTFRTRAILKQQAALGWETVQITSGKQGERAAVVEEIEGLRFYRTPPPKGLSGRLPVVNQWCIVDDLARRLDAAVHAERPHLLHAHSPALNGLAALRVGRRHGLPVVYECRAFWEDAAADHGTSREGGPRYRLTRALESHVFRRADAVTCICEGLRQDIQSRGISPGKLTVIPNAVDAERFAFEVPKDEALAAELGLGGAIVLGFLGSFYAYEGLDLAVAALSLLGDTSGGMIPGGQPVHLLLVGGGPQDARVREQVSALGLGDRVHFTGRVPHDVVERYYGLVDILVYPRRSMRLTELVTPLKPLEAMAQGKLVLASDVGGHRELIQDGVNGRLFAADDAEALAGAVRSMLAARNGWDAQRAAGRRYVEQDRTWPGSVGRYRDVYGRLLGRAAEAGQTALDSEPARR
ncbi:MAG: glycosyltransferase, exosortase A system-associated [Thiohalocapsa sp.]|jgi:PEP-CTERM/exosortase A-associated glycosyltransferase|uniref:TIGR04063 family PEP-CTERM/XrtA system glycosyltransferase n=1 Tax=Thiohalocapsa sp. TaxID=2497641 RepID=UPI0025D93F63|nr:TIGR04063 family PEP-CTERM/XrtA system glycosyltransferase [Thiohalocapsa sp.]MCG6940122.1 glycosyltransferase, exosortase A system-associated [Thiohalocapsa sp.]